MRKLLMSLVMVLFMAGLAAAEVIIVKADVRRRK